MRTVFIQQLISEARKNDKIFLVVGDLGYSVVEPFAKEFPDRFLNAGIAEQNMTGIAAGLSLEGYNVFTYSIGNFPTLRCMEQIRYDVCYHNLNVKIVAVGGGYAYGALGVSHHATEELGMLRTIPGLTVTAPGDPVEARLITSLFANHKGPGYIRMGKSGEPVVHSTEPTISWPGVPLKIREGKDKAVFTTGSILNYVHRYVTDNSLDYGLYSVPVIKPVDTFSFAEIFNRYKEIMVFEEHQLSGGFGSAILEILNDLIVDKKVLSAPLIIRKGIRDEFLSCAGDQEYLRNKAGLTF